MVNNVTDLLNNVDIYYSKKLAKYGDTPKGVDWNSEESQLLRFQQLCKIIEPHKAGFSVNDLGCGYGAFLDLLNRQYSDFRYLGVDISTDMISAAIHRHADKKGVRFLASSRPNQTSDYGVASGIFNVRLDYNDSEWLDYIKQNLDILNLTSSLGFAFNCLTSYSDEDKKRRYLYYADPCLMFDLCKSLYSQQVALLHDYGLYEFTILVRKV